MQVWSNAWQIYRKIAKCETFCQEKVRGWPFKRRSDVLRDVNVSVQFMMKC